MKTTPLQQLIAEMRKSPMMYAPALLLIEYNEFLEKEKQFLEDVYQGGYDSKNCNIGYDPNLYIECEQTQTLNEYLKQ